MPDSLVLQELIDGSVLTCPRTGAKFKLTKAPTIDAATEKKQRIRAVITHFMHCKNKDRKPCAYIRQRGVRKEEVKRRVLEFQSSKARVLEKTIAKPTLKTVTLKLNGLTKSLKSDVVETNVTAEVERALPLKFIEDID